MTIHDTLQNTRLQDILINAWTMFVDNLKLCFQRLNEHGRVAVIQQHAGFFIAEDTPRQTGSTGDCGPWVCRFLAQFTGYMNFSGWSANSEQFAIDFRNHMADLYWGNRLD